MTALISPRYKISEQKKNPKQTQQPNTYTMKCIILIWMQDNCSQEHPH